ncbi:MAG: peptidoglycan DD-metalloendopeptidase family protein [Patescibacteria group bacterium]|nr:peptidoglycan DD-metalloendopeptidase family protein [Patescibacteria group bacterium]MDD5490468.1 peptidoglycan DD-metalloendopeptidase family protein [Patescibacteria group bacterium]
MKTKTQKTNTFRLLTIFFIVSIFFLSPGFIKNILAETAKDDIRDEVLNINDQIQSKKDEIDKLKDQSKQYEKLISQKRSEAINLANQINLVENQIAKTKIDIETTEAEMDQVKLEIAGTNLEIGDKEKDIANRKKTLTDYLQLIRKNDDIGYLRVFLLNDSFSDFFDQLKYLENMQTNLRDVLGKVVTLKKELDEKKIRLESQQKDLEKLKLALSEEQSRLQGEILSKELVLENTKKSEAKFQELLSQLRREQQAVSSDIASLEKTIRQKLEASDINFKEGEQAILSWPIPFNGITATFHDPDYPFRYIFEHPAVDLRASQGTAIRAPAPGYIARVRENGFGYNYLMIIHSGGISTVYGHVSAFAVTEDEYVTRGQIVAYTGGAPGTLGAGRLTTGPHLHFEVRLDGIPVNPMDYLINF